MIKLIKVTFLCLLLTNNLSALSHNYLLKIGLGNTFDFETGINKKGTGLPTEAMIKYGFEYGYGFTNNLYLGAALDWNIIYPRNFNFNNQKFNFFTPPVSLWYVPVSDLKLGYIINNDYKITLGMAYYWGLSSSFSYQATDLLFLELSAVIWLDRIFNTGGFYGGGYDNLFLTASLGFKL